MTITNILLTLVVLIVAGAAMYYVIQKNVKHQQKKQLM